MQKLVYVFTIYITHCDCNFQIRFQTKIESNGNEAWPANLTFEILPETFIPRLPCTNDQNHRYVDICNAQIDIQNPASQIIPPQMPTECKLVLSY